MSATEELGDGYDQWVKVRIVGERSHDDVGQLAYQALAFAACVLFIELLVHTSPPRHRHFRASFDKDKLEKTTTSIQITSTKNFHLTKDKPKKTTTSIENT